MDGFPLKCTQFLSFCSLPNQYDTCRRRGAVETCSAHCLLGTFLYLYTNLHFVVMRAHTLLTSFILMLRPNGQTLCLCLLYRHNPVYMHGNLLLLHSTHTLLGPICKTHSHNLAYKLQIIKVFPMGLN